MQSRNQTHVLLIESDPLEAKRVQDVLAEVESNPYCLESVTTVAEARSRLRQPMGDYLIDIVIINQASTVSTASDTDLLPFEQIAFLAPHALILVLDDDDQRGHLALEKGAHEYLAKSHIDSYWLPRVLRYMMQQRQQELVVLAAEKALYDE